ncbi:high affinity immunoglobulin epsilon receptor subunit beta [Vanacampus margaritifer]
MAVSSSVTNVGGMLIVTQVIPQDADDASTLSLQASELAPPAQSQAPPPASPAKKDAGNAVYRQREFPSLGVVQVVIGSLCVLFSLTAISRFLLVHVAFCGGVWFVVSGWLAMAARKRTSVKLMWACLCTNAVSVLLSLGGAAYLSWLLATRWPSHTVCGELLPGEEDAWNRCLSSLHLLNGLLQGLRGLFLTLLLLQAAVCVTLCIFTANAVRTRYRYAPLSLKRDPAST